MDHQEKRSLQVIIGSGPENLGHAVLGFALAVSASASDMQVSVILALNGIAWANDQEPKAQEAVSGFDPIAKYIQILKEQGVAIEMCSTCASQGLGPAQTDRDPYGRVGMTKVAMQAGRPLTQTVVF